MWLKTLLIIIQILSALGIISLVLMQHGKGADMGAALGNNTPGSLFGASGSATFLSRTTAALAALFFVCTLGLTFLNAKPKPSAGVLGTAASTRQISPAAQGQTGTGTETAKHMPSADASVPD